MNASRRFALPFGSLGGKGDQAAKLNPEEKGGWIIDKEMKRE
jgi:hypothetical protein